MRGKEMRLSNGTLYRRITPAYAGKRAFHTVPPEQDWDHPRLCGEKRFAGRSSICRKGSPPPMRGKGSEDSGGVKYTRITPAYAGKSFHFPFKRTAVRDHPRLCGEKSFTPLCESLYIGSPPPMRGKVHGSPACTCGRGITPAYAGKSFIMDCRLQAGQDHPRLCGEKAYICMIAQNKSGSPPPMRGKDIDRSNKKNVNGITPAYAGKRQSLPAEPDKLQDHPRLCGEKTSNFDFQTGTIGSPPPMRGKVFLLRRPVRRRGITPAYAGKS